MSDLRLLIQNHFEGGAFGTVTIDGCIVTGLSNILDGRCAKVLRIQPTRATQVSYRFGGSLGGIQRVDTFVIGGIEGIPDSSTIQVSFFSDVNFTGTEVRRVVTYRRNTVNWGIGNSDTWESYFPRIVAIYFDSIIQYQSILVTINMTFGAGYSSMFAQMGRIMVGHAFSPRINYSPGSKIMDIDPSRRRRTASGGFHIISRRSYRRANLSIKNLDMDDREILSTQLSSIGKLGDIFVVLDKNLMGQDAEDHSFIGRIVSNREYTRTFDLYYASKLILEESCSRPLSELANLAIKVPFLDVQVGDIASISTTFTVSSQTVTILNPGSLLGKYMVSGSDTNIGEFTLTRINNGIRFTLKMGSTTTDGDNITIASISASVFVRIDYGVHFVDVGGPGVAIEQDTDDPYSWTMESQKIMDMINAMLVSGADTNVVLTWLPGAAPTKVIEPAGFSYSGESLSVELSVEDDPVTFRGVPIRGSYGVGISARTYYRITSDRMLPERFFADGTARSLTRFEITRVDSSSPNHKFVLNFTPDGDLKENYEQSDELLQIVYGDLTAMLPGPDSAAARIYSQTVEIYEDDTEPYTWAIGQIDEIVAIHNALNNDPIDELSIIFS